MTGDEIIALTKKHTIFEWAAQGAVDPIPVARAKGVLFLDAGGQALHRLQQPADVRQHRPRRPAGHQGHPDQAERSPMPRRPWRPSRARGWARNSPRSRPATSTSSSSPTAAPKPTRTPSRSRAHSPAARRSWPGIAPTMAARPGRSRQLGDPRRWSQPPMPGVIHVLDPYHGIERGWDDTAGALAYLEEVIVLRKWPCLHAPFSSGLAGADCHRSVVADHLGRSPIMVASAGYRG